MKIFRNKEFNCKRGVPKSVSMMMAGDAKHTSTMCSIVSYGIHYEVYIL